MFTTETTPKNSQSNYWWQNNRQMLFNTDSPGATVAETRERPFNPRPAPTSSLLPVRLSGYAMPWGVESKPFTAGGRQMRDVLTPGAFNRSLAAIREGRLSVPLLLNHDERGRRFLHMHDAGVLLRDHMGGLFLSIDVDHRTNPKGHALHQFMRSNPTWRYLSCQYIPRGPKHRADGLCTIDDADLIEISLGQSAGMGEQWCELRLNNSPLDL